MRVTNWNIERALPAGKRAGRIRERFLKHPADLWILTETHQGIGPDIAYYSVFGSRLEGLSAEGEVMCAIWCRFPLTSLSDDLPDTSRCAAARFVHPEHGGIIVFACVLPRLNGDWRGVPSKGGGDFLLAPGLSRATGFRRTRSFPYVSNRECATVPMGEPHPFLQFHRTRASF